MIRQGLIGINDKSKITRKKDDKGNPAVHLPAKELLVPLSEGIDNFITNSFNSTQAGARKHQQYLYRFKRP